MEKFIQKHEHNILGTLSCVDRIVFKGYLPISWADSFESFLRRNHCLIKEFKTFVSGYSNQVKDAAKQMAEEQNRPYIYLNSRLRKEAYIKQIIERDSITEGLVCVLAATEACQSFRILYDKLLNHSIARMGAKDILTFLGKRFDGRFKGEQINLCKKRFPGARVKHWMKRNWIKMYNKNSAVLRVETVINHPYDLTIYRSGMRKGEPVKGWFPMSKCVANLYRNADIRDALFGPTDTNAKRRLSARITRLFNKLHARGLIAKIPRSRRWRVTQKGWRVLGPLVEAYA